MKFFKKHFDGGKNSGVTGYWLVEIKSLFSIVLLKFEPNHRENFHSHAFNAYTWWIKGEAVEEFKNGSQITWKPSFKPKFTPRSNMHKIHVKGTVWALSIRGPWSKTWYEWNAKEQEIITLTHGRKVIERSNGWM